MCRVLKVSETGYYSWLKNKDTLSSREQLSVEIKKVIDEHPDNDNYGVERMRLALRQKGIFKSHGTVRAAMRESGFLHKARRPHGITKATTEVQERENLIKRDFSAEAPLKKLLCDITEIQCSDGKLYVSVVLDCYSGEILACEMCDNMRKELCIETVKQLKKHFGNLTDTIIHSDRGSQYTSEAYRTLLSDYGMIQSLSGAGHCFDNARMESFFATLKKEKIYRIPTHRMPMEAVKTAIFRYIFAYYNRKRITTTNPLGLPPAIYRERTARDKSPAA